ncbi:unnamed protein product, partial [Polarella glacialis]
MATELTPVALAELQDASHESIRIFLLRKLAGDVVRQVIEALQAHRGFNLAHYTEDDIGEIAGDLSQGSERLRGDISRGLFRLQDGKDTWSSTVSDGGRSCSASSSWQVLYHSPVTSSSSHDMPGVPLPVTAPAEVLVPLTAAASVQSAAPSPLAEVPLSARPKAAAKQVAAPKAAATASATAVAAAAAAV